MKKTNIIVAIATAAIGVSTIVACTKPEQLETTGNPTTKSLPNIPFVMKGIVNGDTIQYTGNYCSNVYSRIINGVSYGSVTDNSTDSIIASPTSDGIEFFIGTESSTDNYFRIMVNTGSTNADTLHFILLRNHTVLGTFIMYGNRNFVNTVLSLNQSTFQDASGSTETRLAPYFKFFDDGRIRLAASTIIDEIPANEVPVNIEEHSRAWWCYTLTNWHLRGCPMNHYIYHNSSHTNCTCQCTTDLMPIL